MVWSDRTDLFQNNLVTATLTQGEIVKARPDRKHPNWLRIKWKNSVYSASREDFRTEKELKSEFKLRKRNLERKIKYIAETIETNRYSINDLFIMIVQLERDRATFYKVSKPRLFHSAGNENEQQRTQSESVHRIPQFRYYPKVSSSEARKLKKDWDDQIQELQSQTQDLAAERQTIIRTLTTAKTRLNGNQELFSKFSKNPQSYRTDFLVVKKNSVGLFLGTNKVNKLYSGDIALGKPDHTNPDWLKIYYKNKWYDSPRDAYKSSSEIHSFHLTKIAVTEQKIVDLDGETNILRIQEESLLQYIRNLSHSFNRQGKYLYSPPLPKRWATHRLIDYHTSAHRNGVEVIDRFQARKAVRGLKSNANVL